MRLRTLLLLVGLGLGVTYMQAPRGKQILADIDFIAEKDLTFSQQLTKFAGHKTSKVDDGIAHITNNIFPPTSQQSPLYSAEDYTENDISFLQSLSALIESPITEKNKEIQRIKGEIASLEIGLVKITEHIDRINSTKSPCGKGYMTVTGDPRPEMRERIEELKQQVAVLEN